MASVDAGPGRVGRPDPVELPPPPEPAGLYEPAVVHGGLVFTAGMTPRRDGVPVAVGRLGAEVDLAAGRDAAGLAALRALSAAAAAVGGPHRLVRLIRLGVLVRCTPEFADQSAVADGASRALLDALGDAGRVARTAYGVPALPGGACVEVELVAACEPADRA
ncbi:MAG TPA: RidA family protein [Mycobacteriales bacterium]|nr:RidA family protein [Mycobacteriales bacterium]